MSAELTVQSGGAVAEYRLNPDEYALLEGDLSKLSEARRMELYQATCRALRLNPLTNPFQYIKLNGRLKLYATKDCTDQLRQIHGISITDITTQEVKGIYVVKAHARNALGREDVSTGALEIANLKGEFLANALMKCETKAKRRVTLSICGMGMLDESELHTIAGAQFPEVATPANPVVAPKDAATEDINRARDEVAAAEREQTAEVSEELSKDAAKKAVSEFADCAKRNGFAYTDSPSLKVLAQQLCKVDAPKPKHLQSALMFRSADWKLAVEKANAILKGGSAAEDDTDAKFHAYLVEECHSTWTKKGVDKDTLTVSLALCMDPFDEEDPRWDNVKPIIHWSRLSDADLVQAMMWAENDQKDMEWQGDSLTLTVEAMKKTWLEDRTQAA